MSWQRRVPVGKWPKSCTLVRSHQVNAGLYCVLRNGDGQALSYALADAQLLNKNGEEVPCEGS